MTPIVGIPACTRLIGELVQHATPARYGEALIFAAGCLPVLLPPVGPGLVEILDRLDGLLLDGSPSNVEPSLYGATDDLTPGKHDPARDSTTLPLVRAAIARGMPVLAICRGVQELNVAMGGTLHQQVHLLDGRDDHRSGPGSIDEKFGFSHDVTLSGGPARPWSVKTEITVNSLHEQALDRIADGLSVEGVAADGTVEAVQSDQRTQLRIRRAVPPGMACADGRAKPGDLRGVRRGLCRLRRWDWRRQHKRGAPPRIPPGAEPLDLTLMKVSSEGGNHVGFGRPRGECPLRLIPSNGTGSKGSALRGVRGRAPRLPCLRYSPHG